MARKAKITQEHAIYMIPMQNGDYMVHCKRKGGNPEREKRPALKCPSCKKVLQTVYDKYVKNDTILFDVKDPDYAAFPRNHVFKCSRCHRMIGAFILDDEMRTLLRLPLQRDRKARIPVEEIKKRIEERCRPSSHL